MGRLRIAVRRACFLILVIMAVLPLVATPAKAATMQDASQAISIAEGASQITFKTIHDAQVAGANTSDLEFQFNLALQYLSSAEVAEGSGNYAAAVAQAQTATSIFQTVNTESINLENQAASQSELRSALVVLSGVISVVLFTAGFRFAEKWHYRRWLKKLPEMRIRLKEDRREADNT